MLLAVFALVAGLMGGLARLGLVMPVPPSLVAFHGPLMIGGFLGTVIGLERAVALGRLWGYAGPLASGLGALALASGVPGGPGLMMAGSAVMMLVFVGILKRQMAVFTLIMALGAACWLVGQLLWLAGQPIHRVVFWWAGFLVLTIAGERLEMTRLLRRGVASRATFSTAIVVLVVAVVLVSRAPYYGFRLIGVALVGLAMWLGVFDIARRTVAGSGLTRFIAVALLSGYVWLGVAGVLTLAGSDLTAGPRYDAVLHALFLGFTFSMIFGHAPIIFPAVLGIGIDYRPVFYVHVGLLHGSLVLRVLGDLLLWAPGRYWGGLLNALAIVVFFADTGYGVLQARRPRQIPSHY